MYVWRLCSYSHTTARRTGVYQMRCTAYKVAPDDGLIQSETCRASNRKWSLITRILFIFFGLYTYCRMMHGAYSVKHIYSIKPISILQVTEQQAVLLTTHSLTFTHTIMNWPCSFVQNLGMIQNQAVSLSVQQNMKIIMINVTQCVLFTLL